MYPASGSEHLQPSSAATVQAQKEGESSQQFAERVQTLIAKRAGLKAVPWDGYLKYYNLAVKVCLPKVSVH